jgi:hypothetical protein
MTNVIAKTILAQLGGNRFVAMTGSKDFVATENGLTFKLAKVYNGISHVNVTLDCDDTYRVTFNKWNARRLQHAIVATHAGIYCDMLQDLFTNETGLYTTL